MATVEEILSGLGHVKKAKSEDRAAPIKRAIYAACLDLCYSHSVNSEDDGQPVSIFGVLPSDLGLVKYTGWSELVKSWADGNGLTIARTTNRGNTGGRIVLVSGHRVEVKPAKQAK